MTHHRTTQKFRIGLDEVGRGPLAGPITVGCVALPSRYTWAYLKRLEARGEMPPLRDSKKLTEKQREAWYAWVVKQPDIQWAVASSTALVIDSRGIVFAGNAAADTAYAKVMRRCARPGLVARSGLVNAHVRLDYGLCLKKAPEQQSFKKGDERFPEIALASIMAKVTRDRYMQKIDKQYPVYSFARNKGYGSKAHYAALKSHGLCKMHRVTFMHCV